ncbi:hypothetical protein [Fusobacterium polymorphum]|jgi:hypothetical protein|uniref:hypothetical protein n=1 Tax=Fusobacterium nucleatum subsp. polymorphum TaxID=76857 RepID=UPI00300892DD
MNNQDLYFKNEEVKYIFYLVALEGKLQMDFLGIDRGHYENRERSKIWYEEIKKKIKDSKHPKLEEAVENLNKLYRGMGGKINY